MTKVVSCSTDHKDRVYDTQGRIVEKTVQQQFSDSFLSVLSEHNENTRMPEYLDFVNPYNPTCMNTLKTDTVADKITAIDYHNKGAGFRGQSKPPTLHRIG
jgi:hypothetical protein